MDGVECMRTDDVKTDIFRMSDNGYVMNECEVAFQLIIASAAE